MHAIEIRDLKKKYTVGFLGRTEKWGLKGLSLDVAQGEVFGCLGPNGAGKTTTIKLLMGLSYPTAGSARILDREIGDPEMRREIGFLPEQPYFYDYLTGREFLEYFAQLSGVSSTERRPRAIAMLEKVGLKDSADVQLRKFSKGMLQRAGIAQAIIHDPKVVFLDEPMSGLDPVGRGQVRDLIHQLNDEGKTIFFSTHILSDAEALCDRVCVLAEGELRSIGVVAELMAAAHGSLEVTWQGRLEIPEIRALSSACRVIGETARALVPETELYKALDILRKSECRLVSAVPAQHTLEEYFLHHIQPGSRPEVRP